MRIAIAESCTGGWICKVLTDPPGSSAWFDCGLIVYSNTSKVHTLGVSAELLETAGAVSEEAVLAMVDALARRCSAELIIAVSGVSGPAGGSVEKPVGTVWMAAIRRGYRCQSRCFHFDGDRNSVRRQAVLAALELIADAARDP